jgi:predicted transcriptional regulator
MRMPNAVVGKIIPTRNGALIRPLAQSKVENAKAQIKEMSQAIAPMRKTVAPII